MEQTPASAVAAHRRGDPPTAVPHQDVCEVIREIVNLIRAF